MMLVVVVAPDAVAGGERALLKVDAACAHEGRRLVLGALIHLLCMD